MASIQGIYLALFGRPADPSGLAYYSGVTNNGADLSAIGNLAGQKEYLDRFAGLGPSQIVNSIYQSLFGRAGEQAGVDFWVGRLASGALTVNNIAIAILDGASGTDKLTVDAKIAAADLFTSHLDQPAEQSAYNAATLASVRDYLTAIDATHLASAANIDALILKLAASPGQAPASGADVGGGGGAPPAAVQPISLTVLDADHVSPSSPDPVNRTTSADDRVTVSDAYHAVGTIDGGAGFDTVVVTTVGAVAPTSGSIQNIERLDINPTGPKNVVDLHDVQGLKEISLINGLADIDGIGKSVTVVNLQGIASNFVHLFLADASSSDDTITLKPDNFNLSGRGPGLDMAGFEHVLVDAQSASRIDGLMDADLRTLSIIGKNEITLQSIELHSHDLVIDTSSHIGDSTVLIRSRDPDTSVKFVGGAGSDIFGAPAGNLTISGGGGANAYNIDLVGGHGFADMDVITDFNPERDTLFLSVLTHKFYLETALSPTDQGRIATSFDLQNALSNVHAIATNYKDADGSWAIEFVYRNDTYVFAEDAHGTDNLIKLTGVLNPIDPQHLIVGTYLGV